jgi:hypothetical protein
VLSRARPRGQRGRQGRQHRQRLSLRARHLGEITPRLREDLLPRLRTPPARLAGPNYCCDCAFYSSNSKVHSGCKVTSAPPPGYACKCFFTDNGETVCNGEVADCAEPGSPYCDSGTSVQSCVQGRGDCQVGTSPAPPPRTGPRRARARVGGGLVGPPRMPRGRARALVPMCRGSGRLGQPRCGAAWCPDARMARCRSLQGYTEECNCDYHYKFPSGGCKISVVPPKYTTCKCSYWGSFKCSGELVSCPSTNAFCKTPDGSFNTCSLGPGGDCEGY